MDVYSWLRRTISRPENTSLANGGDKKQQERQGGGGGEEEIFGITDRLIDFIKTFDIDTFKNFPLKDEEEEANCGDDAPATTGSVRKDLSEWQQQHATIVLSKVKEMSQLRFRLCPRHLKEQQFWRIYFRLVKSYVAVYELRAIQMEKLRQMTLGAANIPDSRACEVEMSETKQSSCLAHSASSEHNLDALTHDDGSVNE